MILQGKAQYPVKDVVLHCAAIKTGQFAGMKPIQVWWNIDQWHKRRGWQGFGYHGLFMPDGLFMAGRPHDKIGAGVMGFNRGVIHLLMIERREIKRLGHFLDYFTEEQRTAVRSYIRALPGIERVSGHNDHAVKLCPGFKVQSSEWLGLAA